VGTEGPVAVVQSLIDAFGAQLPQRVLGKVATRIAIAARPFPTTIYSLGKLRVKVRPYA
jgi:hypothetical protein